MPDTDPEFRREYTASALVDLTLAGHFCIRESIDKAIRKIHRLDANLGLDRIRSLPNLKAYPSEPEIDHWQSQLLALLANIENENNTRRREIDDKQKEPDLFAGPN